jgi:hypothetical protein
VREWEEEKFNNGRERQIWGSTGAGLVAGWSSVLASRTRQTGYGDRSSSDPKWLLLVHTPTTLGNVFLQPTRPTCTLHPRSCTRLVRLDEGYQITLEARKLGHFPILYG